MTSKEELLTFLRSEREDPYPLTPEEWEMVEEMIAVRNSGRRSSCP